MGAHPKTTAPPPLYLKHSTGVGGGIPYSFGLHPDVCAAVQTAGWVDLASSWRKHQTINYRGGITGREEHVHPAHWSGYTLCPTLRCICRRHLWPYCGLQDVGGSQE